MTTNRTMVKLDGELYEITKTDKGVTATPVSPETIVEESVLGEGVEKFLNNDFNKIVNVAYGKVHDTLTKGIKDSVLKALGVEENKWDGGFTVNHHAKIGVITEHIKDACGNMFRDEIMKMMESEKDAILKSLKPALRKHIRQVVKDEMNNVAYGFATKALHNFVQDVVNAEMERLRPDAIKRLNKALLNADERRYNNSDDNF